MDYKSNQSFSIVSPSSSDTNANNVFNEINFSSEDFVSFRNRNGEFEVDITKSGILKILKAIPNYSLVTDIVIADENKVIVKATISAFSKVASGLGACSKSEIETKRKEIREFHDMLAIAETRAIKRAIDFLLGTEEINIAAKKFLNDIVSSQKLPEKVSESINESQKSSEKREIQSQTQKSHPLPEEAQQTHSTTKQEQQISQTQQTQHNDDTRLLENIKRKYSALSVFIPIQKAKTLSEFDSALNEILSREGVDISRMTNKEKLQRANEIAISRVLKF